MPGVEMSASQVDGLWRATAMNEASSNAGMAGGAQHASGSGPAADRDVAQHTRWLEAQYNNRARIPEHPQIFARWAGASAEARARLGVELDLPYGPTPGQRLDVFPSDEAGAPLLVFIHGGWWRSLDKSDQSLIAPAFVQGGATVVIPNYDLCPAVGVDAIARQMADALAWVWRNASRWGADRRRIVLVGHSAGAHLAAMLLCTDWPALAPDLPAGLVRQAVGLSGVYDLDALMHTPFLQQDLHLDEALVASLSPARLAAPKGRLAALVGALESEEFHRQNQLIASAWGPRAVPVCEALPGVHHLAIVDELAEPGTRVQSLVWEMLDQPG
jgi:arylformamidase